jgi:hypothetical protein
MLWMGVMAAVKMVLYSEKALCLLALVVVSVKVWRIVWLV